MRLVSVFLFLFSLAAQTQSTPADSPVGDTRPHTARTRAPGSSKDAGGAQQPAPAQRKGLVRTRRGLAVLGAAIAGAGVIVLVTAGRTRDVPAANCSFYPAPIIPCAAAHTEKTRSGVQECFGGGMLAGGFVLVYASMR